MFKTNGQLCGGNLMVADVGLTCMQWTDQGFHSCVLQALLRAKVTYSPAHHTLNNALTLMLTAPVYDLFMAFLRRVS